jgi:hypothetical protein
MKPKRSERTKIINILMQISKVATIALAMWAAMGTFLALGENFYILLYVDGYKPAVFTIKELKFYKGSTSGFGRTQTTTLDSYRAYGEIAGHNDQFGLKGFAKGFIQSQSDLEKEFSVGQKLQVLYNPNIPKKLNVHIQYPEKDFKKTHERRRMQMLKHTYGPWIMSFCVCLFLGIFTKNIRGIILVALMSLLWMGIGWIFVSFYFWL